MSSFLMRMIDRVFSEALAQVKQGSRNCLRSRSDNDGEADRMREPFAQDTGFTALPFVIGQSDGIKCEVSKRLGLR
jgi:hypothetical protein